MARKVALLWNATEMVDTESQEAHAEWSLPLRLGGLVGHFGILVPLALFGVFVTWPMRSRLWVLYAMTLAYAASVVVFYVFARYRYPLVPLLILFAAAGVVGARAFISRGRRTGAGGPMDRPTPPSWPRSRRPSSATGRCCRPTLMRAVTETNLGSALQADGRLDEAIDHYHRAIAFAPEFPPAYNNLGDDAAREGPDRRGDRRPISRRCACAPTIPDAQYNLANALLRGRQAGGGDRSLPRRAPDDPGVGRRPQQPRDRADGSGAGATKRSRSSARRWSSIPTRCSRTSTWATRSERRITTTRRSSSSAAPRSSIRPTRRSTTISAACWSRSIGSTRRSPNSGPRCSIDPKSAKTLNNLGIALGSQGRMDEAIDQFRKALAVQPDFEDAQHNLAIALQVKGK